MTRHLHRAAAVVGTLLGLLPGAVRAQTTISGTVTNEAQTPVQGVSVSIPTMSVGGYTDANGHYSFTVASGRATGQTVMLQARRIGYQATSASIVLSGSAVAHNFTLTTAATQLGDVVVTALGETREKSQLGTAQQTVNADQLNQTFDPNLVNQLSGKVSGVNIVGSGTQGGSTNITIRGYTSISNSNQPLFVVDGIPVRNDDRGSSQSGGGMTGSKDFGSTIQDINPDDIESMTVLKGPNAAALYGSRAANGVILITTRHGAAGTTSTEITSSITWDRPSRLPDYQNSYGQGSAGEFEWVNGQGALDGNDQSYGPRFDGKPRDQFTGKGMPWVAHPDNVSSFFNTGKTMNSTFAVSGGNEKANGRLSLSGENVDGIIPNNFLRRLGGTANGTFQLSDRLSTTGSLSYTRNSGANRPGQGYVGGVLEQFVWFGRQVDMNALRSGYNQSATINNGPANREFNWNYSYHNNPFWMQYDNPERDQRDRIIANGSATYKVADWLNATLRTGTDYYHTNIDADYSEGNIELNNGSTTVDPAYAGAFSLVRDVASETNTEFLLQANKLVNRFDLHATGGANSRYENSTSEGVYTTGISVPGIYNIANAGIAPVNSQAQTTRKVNSIYGSAAFTYNGWWTVEGTARNDWSSTLPKDQNSYFYPSVNTSVVLTDAIPSLKTGALDYLKLRGSIARVGADANPYNLYTTYAGSASKFGGLPLFTLGNALLNPNLKPEQTTSTEGGVEFGLFGGRLSFDGSIYDKYTTDEITNVTVSNASGYGTVLINAGKIDNKGYEALISLDAYRGKNWSWNTSFNYSHNQGRVISLNPGLKTIYLSNFFGNGTVTTEARVGEPFGVIRGYRELRDSATNQLVLQGGLPVSTNEQETLGNIQPRWTGGWLNTLRYKGVTLNTTLDMHIGGNVFSGTNYFGDATGVLARTMYGREVDWDNPGITAKGLDMDTCGPDSHFTDNNKYVCVGGSQNTTNVTSENWFQNNQYVQGVVEPYVYDDTWVKLREVRLSFNLPQAIVRKLYATNASVSLVGRNLWTSTKVPNIDPEFSYTTANNQGLEYGVLPSPRSFGFSLRVTP